MAARSTASPSPAAPELVTLSTWRPRGDPRQRTPSAARAAVHAAADQQAEGSPGGPRPSGAGRSRRVGRPVGREGRRSARRVREAGAAHLTDRSTSPRGSGDRSRTCGQGVARGHLEPDAVDGGDRASPGPARPARRSHRRRPSGRGRRPRRSRCPPRSGERPELDRHGGACRARNDRRRDGVESHQAARRAGARGSGFPGCVGLADAQAQMASHREVHRRVEPRPPAIRP